MKRDKEIREELNALTPGFPVPRKYEAPDHYFDQLPDQILTRWKNNTTPGSLKTGMIRRMITAAAVVTGLSLGIVRVSQKPVSPAGMSGISSMEAYQYILENMEEFDMLMLEATLRTEEVPMDLPHAEDVEQFLIEELQDVEIESLF